MNKLNTLTIIMFGASIILIYAGIKDKSPKDVIQYALKGQSPAGAPSATSGGSSTSGAVYVTPSPKDHPAKKQQSGSASV